MGDRTYVTLRVLEAQADEAEALFGGYGNDSKELFDGLVEFGFPDVNYGNLDFLSDLIDAGIAYNSHWDNGSEYGPGTEYGRYKPNGEAVTVSVYEAQANPPMDRLLENIDNHELLRKVILDHHAACTVLPLDADQIKYGRKHRTLQLITPAECIE